MCESNQHNHPFVSDKKIQKPFLLPIQNYFLSFLSTLLLLISLSNCKKLVEVSPPVTSINGANVYTSDVTAAAVLTGIYAKMSSNTITTNGITSMSFLPALSSDELTLFSGVTNSSFIQYYENNLNVSSNPASFWSGIYAIIFASNSAIEGLSNSTNLSPASKLQLIGEAKFVRALCYFYLVNLYGDVPLPLTTNWQVNSGLARSPKAQVWQQVITDLKEAQGLLNDKYVEADAITTKTSTERIRPNKWVATALLARSYLYTGDYVNAEAEATTVIANSSMYSLSSFANVFLKNSVEAIWQLQPVLPQYNTSEAKVFILPKSGPSNPSYPVYLNDGLIKAFEVGDKRKINWLDSVVDSLTIVPTTYYYAAKYKVWDPNAKVSEYTMVLRLAEQFLIRAEARAYKNDISGAKSDLNIIRTRAGLPNTSADDKTSLLSAIEHERRVELFTEWGHRWLDLKRTNRINEVMSVAAPQKGGSWSTNWQWYPIPLSELQKNPQLVQNPGY